MARPRTKKPTPTPKTEASAGFAIGTYDQGLIEDNLRDRVDRTYGDPVLRQEWADAGLIDAKGELTAKGSEVLSTDISRLERNSTAWLAHKFSGIRVEGHDNHSDLVGSLWFDPANPSHAYLIELASQSPGRSERIDMVDSSFGDLANTAFDGVSEFGAHILGGAITFFDVDPASAWDEIEATLDKQRQRDRKVGNVTREAPRRRPLPSTPSPLDRKRRPAQRRH